MLAEELLIQVTIQLSMLGDTAENTWYAVVNIATLDIIIYDG